MAGPESFGNFVPVGRFVFGTNLRSAVLLLLAQSQLVFPLEEQNTRFFLMLKLGRGHRRPPFSYVRIIAHFTNKKTTVRWQFQKSIQKEEGVLGAGLWPTPARSGRQPDAKAPASVVAVRAAAVKAGVVVS